MSLLQGLRAVNSVLSSLERRAKQKEREARRAFQQELRAQKQQQREYDRQRKQAEQRRLKQQKEAQDKAELQRYVAKVAANAPPPIGDKEKQALTKDHMLKVEREYFETEYSGKALAYAKNVAKRQNKAECELGHSECAVRGGGLCARRALERSEVHDSDWGRFIAGGYKLNAMELRRFPSYESQFRRTVYEGDQFTLGKVYPAEVISATHALITNDIGGQSRICYTHSNWSEVAKLAS